jgi:hypothetical protein
MLPQQKKTYWGTQMQRREFIALLGGAAGAMPWPTRAEAGQSIAAQLAGAWHFVSSTNRRKDGGTFDRWGPDAKGMFMFDDVGHFSQIIMSSESWVFGAKSLFSFGSYSIAQDHKTIVSHIEGSSLARLIGTDQRRIILALTADELKYVNPHTSSGSEAEVVWKRMRQPLSNASRLK